MTAPVLSAVSLVKQFGPVRAVDGLSFEVVRGEVFALLGPNGAGKTTTLRMLLGILRPDHGEVRYALDGAPRWPSASQVGYLPEERGLFRESPVGRTVAYFGVLRGLDRRAADRAAAAWLERMGLADRAHERPDALSKGNQQKVQLAAALVHRPAVAFLDEPFSGLDPVNQELFLDLLQEMRAAGTTVVLSAHQMALVERVADRVLVVNRGREALRGTLSDLRRQHRVAQRLRLVVDPPADPAPLARHPGVARAEWGAEGVVTVELTNDDALGEVLALAASAYRLRSIHAEPPSLHDIYLRAVGAEAPDGSTP